MADASPRVRYSWSWRAVEVSGGSERRMADVGQRPWNAPPAESRTTAPIMCRGRLL